ncbi:WxL protein peptidoglycan domain-containing protein [Streptomyces sp. NPDC050418]|uniref:COG1470 family protein n=1 Tax=Streptomyces sp. NPDC050418 TaxID=3365612 RepID=UPI0037A6DD7B
MQSARRFAAVCLLAVAGLVGLPAGAAVADDDPAWSVAPSSGSGARPAEDGRPYFYMEGAPGAVLEDTVTVTNPGDAPATVRLRAAEAYNRADGSFDVRDSRGGRPSGAGGWLSFADDKVKIPPRTRAEVPFSVSVPDGATPGDHPAALIAEMGGRKAGVRVHLRVSGPTLSAVTVENVTVDGDTITYSLVNRGNTVLTPKLAVHAEGLFGEVLDRGARALPVELLPGRKVTLREPWTDRPAFDSVRVELTVSADGAAKDTQAAEVRLVPWAAVAGGAVLVVGGAGLAVFAVRRRRAVTAFKAELQPPDGQRELVTAGARENK